MSHVPIKHKERLKLKSTEICNVIDIMTARRVFDIQSSQLRLPVVCHGCGFLCHVVAVVQATSKYVFDLLSGRPYEIFTTWRGHQTS